VGGEAVELVGCGADQISVRWRRRRVRSEGGSSRFRYAGVVRRKERKDVEEAHCGYAGCTVSVLFEFVVRRVGWKLRDMQRW